MFGANVGGYYKFYHNLYNYYGVITTTNFFWSEEDDIIHRNLVILKENEFDNHPFGLRLVIL